MSNKRSSLVSALQTKDAQTANGAVTHSSTDSALLDMFAIIGSLRISSDAQILAIWAKGYAEDPRLALQMLLWIRDTRGGAGERRTFRVIYGWLKQYAPEHARLISERIPIVGRWDDLWKSGRLSDRELELIAENMENPLLCKWLPRRGDLFRRLAEVKKWSLGTLRKHLASTSKTVEQFMSANKWDKITYEHVPSKAMSIYNGAFGKHDKKRFDSYVAAVTKGETKINAGTLYPYDLLLKLTTNKQVNADVVNAQWTALPNYGDTEENILVVADVSGSMGSIGQSTLAPIHASISLAMYTSERNKGIFKDTFITFSANPQLQVLAGTLQQRVAQLSRADWGMNTDLQAVFELILNKAKKHNIPAEEMPTKIVIVSDMEFDRCVSNKEVTNFKGIKDKYQASAYELPAVVFWNVNGRAGNNPIKAHNNNVALISGYSPSILPSIMGKRITPFEVMMSTIDKDRYRLAISR